MYKIISVLGATVIFSSAGWSTPPCAPIARACEHAGYYKGGSAVGKGLITNCMIPILKKQKNLPDVTFNDDTLQLCDIQLRELTKQYQ